MKIDSKLKIVVIGSGGREHAIAWKISYSKHVEKIFCIPGNTGTVTLKNTQNINLNITDYAQIINFCKNQQIDLVVIGPEQPLQDGFVDMLNKNNIKSFGPTQNAAQLETSKAFTKKLCKDFNIPTAKYEIFQNYQNANNYLVENNKFPIVIKQNGLAAGKGVFIAHNLETAQNCLREALSNDSVIIIEEFLEGVEASFFAIITQNNIIPFSSAQDYKKVYDGDAGPNTGGMGTYSPSKYIDQNLEKQIINNIIDPTIQALKSMNIIYTGVLFAGLMLTQDGPKLIEYNCRFGDPETQSILLRLDSDLLEIFMRTTEDNFNDFNINFSQNYAVCVVMANQGYPEDFCKDTLVILPENFSAQSMIFHAGTKYDNGNIIAKGGRVLGVSAYADTIDLARQKAYNLVSEVDWSNAHYRKDIAKL